MLLFNPSKHFCRLRWQIFLPQVGWEQYRYLGFLPGVGVDFPTPGGGRIPTRYLCTPMHHKILCVVIHRRTTSLLAMRGFFPNVWFLGEISLLLEDIISRDFKIIVIYYYFLKNVN